MHVYFILRGIKQCADLFKRDIQSQYFPRGAEDTLRGKIPLGSVQGALRPIELFEYVFPREHRDLVLRSIFQKPSGEPKEQRLSKYQFILRKLLKAQKMPEDINWDDTQKLPIYKDNIQTLPIGFKDDADATMKYEAL